jgi:hypothetical protein
LGTAPAALPQVVDVKVMRLADAVRRFSIASTLPASEGNADSRSAAPPATCGPAIEVPEREE